MAIFIGCAGWALRKEFAHEFPSEGTHLRRYARRLNAVEINSSFYSSHRASTYERWAEETPGDFRFSVKLPKQITHMARLIGIESNIDQFVAETSMLGQKLGAILVQFPPSLRFEPLMVDDFFRALRMRTAAPIVCEPRHRSWFEPDVEPLLLEHQIGRVAADPSVVSQAAIPAGDRQCLYYRWHGSPRMYYSAYDDQALRDLAAQLCTAARPGRDVWCIFDNTALSAATKNALTLTAMLERSSPTVDILQK